MGTPDDIDVWIGLDIGKAEHFADVLDAAGDQPGSLASLVLAVAARLGVPVAYVPGLVMRRAADLYPGESKTDRRDAFVLADTGRTRRHQVHWLDAGNDELLDQLRVLNGYDADLAADATRLSNRLRDALTSVSPALERVLSPRLHHPRAYETSSPAPWLRLGVAGSRGRSASARLASRRRSPQLSPRPSTRRPSSSPSRR